MPIRTLLVTAALAVAAAPALADAVDPTVDKPDASITDGSAQKALDAARAKWKAAHTSRYDFRAALSCFCPEDIRKARTLKVRGGAAVKPPSHLTDVATVPRIFKKIQGAIDGKVAGLTVSYGRYGVPRSLFIDRSRMIADEEMGYSFDRFKRR